MAITPQKTDPAFLREVDEELRRDQVEQIARRYGRIAVVVIVVALVALAAALIWNNRRAAAREDEAVRFDTALADLGAGQGAKAGVAIDAVAASGHAGYRALALLTKADMAVQAGKDADAVAQYKRIAGDAAFAQPLRDLARVRGAAIAFDSTPPATIIAELGDLAKPGNPWFGSAGEMVAMAQRNAGRNAEAAKLFAALAKDPSVPDTIRTRAMQMAGALGVDAVPATAATDRKETR